MDIEKDNIILESLAKLARVFKSNEILCGLTYPELVTCKLIMHNVKMNKPTQAKDLAVYAKVSKPAVSKLLNSMEEKGIIRRERRAENRKAVYVVLTEEGESVLEKQAAMAAVISKRVFAEMGTAKAKEFIELVDCFYESYKKVVDK